MRVNRTLIQAFSVRGGKIFVFGGFNGSWLTDTYLVSVPVTSPEGKLNSKRQSSSSIDIQKFPFEQAAHLGNGALATPPEWSDRESSNSNG